MVRAWVGAHQLLVLQGELLVELGVERGRLRPGRLRAHLALLAQQPELLGLLRVRGGVGLGLGLGLELGLGFGLFR